MFSFCFNSYPMFDIFFSMMLVFHKCLEILDLLSIFISQNYYWFLFYFIPPSDDFLGRVSFIIQRCRNSLAFLGHWGTALPLRTKYLHVKIQVGDTYYGPVMVIFLILPSHYRFLFSFPFLLLLIKELFSVTCGILVRREIKQECLVFHLALVCIFSKQPSLEV